MKKEAYALLAILLFALSFLFDKQIILLITSFRFFPVSYVMIWFSNMLTIAFVLLFVATLFLWKEKRKRFILPLWLSFLLSGLISVAIKLLTGRLRPFETLTFPLIPNIDYSFAFWNSSFPSFHALAAFAALPILDKAFPKIKWFWISFAVLIILSRLYLGVHYLSDVVAGVIIGYLLGYYIMKKLKI